MGKTFTLNDFFGGEPIVKTLGFFGTNPIIQGLPAWLWGTEGADGLVWVTLGPKDRQNLGITGDHHLGWLKVKNTLYLVTAIVAIWSGERLNSGVSYSTLQENLVSLIFLSTFHISSQVCNVAAQCCKYFVETMGGQSCQVLPGFPTTAGADLPCKWNNTTGTSSPYVHRKTWRPATQPCNITTGNGVKWIEMVSETAAQ